MKMYEIFIHANSITFFFTPNYELKLIFESDKLYGHHTQYSEHFLSL
jgi:hypothetical protein